MTDRSIIVEEKRRRLLDAAVRVFAEKGYHGCRVGDIAEEAGVAYGLLYHYFASKEEVLETIFRETWGRFLEDVRSIEASGAPARAQLAQLVEVYLGAWERDPQLVRVLVREVARSPEVQKRVDEIAEVFRAIRRMIKAGQERGELRPDADPRLASWIFYGALEEILTGWALGQLPDSEEDVARAQRTVVELIVGGLEREPVVAPG